MKTLIATLLLSTSALAAASTTPARFSMSTQQFAAYRGSYELENGKTADIYAVDGRFYLEVEGRARVEIQALDAQTFVSRDQGVRVEFDKPAQSRHVGLQLVFAK